MKPKRRNLFLNAIFVVCSVALAQAGNDLEIVAGNGNTNINNADPFVTTDDSALLGVDLITGGLAGGNVSVTTGTGGADSEAGNITLSTAIDYDGAGSTTLNLTALNNITLSGNILDSTPGGDLLNLNLNAGLAGTINLNNTVDLSGGILSANGQAFVLGNVLSAGILDISGFSSGSALAIANLNVTTLAGMGSDSLTGTSADESIGLTATNTGTFGAMNFTGVSAIDAAGGNDTVTTNAAANLTGNANEATSNSITVSNFETLVSTHGTLNGSASNETFNHTGDAAGDVAGINYSGITTINGGSGDDTLNFGATQSSPFSFVGGDGDDTVNATADVTLNAGDNFNAENFNTGSNTVNITGNNLVDSIALNVNGGTLNVNGGETVGSLTNTGTITIADGVTLSASTINNNSGTIGVGVGSTLQGTGNTLNNNATINIATNGVITDAGAINNNAGGVINFNGPGGTATFNAGGAGTGVITNAGQINLLSGNVLVGNDDVTTSNLINVAGGSTISGMATLGQTGGTIGGAGNVGVNGLFTQSGGTTSGTVTITSNGFTQSGGASVAAGTTVTSSGAQSLTGGTIAGTLNGTGAVTASVGTTTLSGTVTNAASFTVSGGTVNASGTIDTSGNSVTISSGVLTVTGNVLADNEAVTNAGTLTVNGNDTVNTYTQTATGTLAGTATLTVTGGATLNGGTVSGNLSGNTTSTADVLVSGSIGGGSLSVTGGTLTLTGTSTNGPVTISTGAALVDSGTLNAGAVTNAGTLTINAPATVASLLNNNGLVNGSSVLTVTGATTFNGGTLDSPLTINGGGPNAFNSAVIAGTFNGGGILDNSTVSGAFNGNAMSTGSTLVSGTIGNGSLAVNSGTFTLTGTSTNTPVTIAAGATLLNQSGGLSNSANVTNAGTLTVNANDTVGTYTQNGAGLLGGTATLTAGTATLNGGLVTGSLNGTMGITSSGMTLLTSTGVLSGGSLTVSSGILDMRGTVNTNTLVSVAGTLDGTGVINGNLDNQGSLLVGSNGNLLTINGSLVTSGSISLNVNSNTVFDKVSVTGDSAFGGSLSVNQIGTGLADGQSVQLFGSGTYSGTFSSINLSSFSNPVFFNQATGVLSAIAAGPPKASRAFANLNLNQTDVYLSLYEDAARKNAVDVTVLNNLPQSYTYQFSNIFDTSADPELRTALDAALNTTPGIVDKATINSLSPEVHRGMVDYTEQALRSHVRAGIDAAPISRTGNTQVFATVHYNTAGADASDTNANYDTEMTGVTVGVRHDIDQRFQIGGLFGADDGSIDGALIDTDAQGWVLGVFGRYLLHEASQTKLTASLSYGSYEYDASRRSFGGSVTANGIESDAYELAIGISTVSFEKDGFRVVPNAGIRYLTGSVDSFVESGSGVPLSAREQDIDSLLLEVGVDFEYQVQEQLGLFGHLGYVTDFEDSDNSVSASYAASGAAGRPFTVRAPGIDDEAFVMGLGAYYDINDAARVGLTYRGEFRSNSETAHSIGLGASFGF